MVTHNNATPEAIEAENIYPIFCIDLWEHAYVGDYGTDIDSYIDAFWHVLNWEKVEQRMVFARRRQLFITDRMELL